MEVLYANLEKLKLLTKKIQGSLNRLETGGNVVKHAIGPIYSNTQSLQITNSNIDKVNEAIERLRQPLDAKGKEEGIIRSRYAAAPWASGQFRTSLADIREAPRASAYRSISLPSSVWKKPWLISIQLT